jgi:hypothetical protein
MATDIITLLLTVGAAIIGIIGNTWDKDKKGIKKLTITGWISTVLALAGLILGIHQAVEKSEKLDRIKQLKEIAYNELEHETSSLMEPFLISVKQIDKEISTGESYYRVSYFDTLIKKYFRDENQIKRIDFYSIAGNRGNHANMPLWKIFSKAFSDNNTKLNSTVAKYNLYLPEEVLLNIHKLTNSCLSEFTTELLPVTATQDSLRNNMSHSFWSFVGGDFILEPEDFSEEKCFRFFENLYALRQQIAKKP